MDKLEKYRALIKGIITQYVDLFNTDTDPDIKEIAVFDDERGHYQWLSLGWKNDKRAFYVHLYVRLHNDKIYIEADWTEDGIATELVREGVPREDIVLAFHSPKMRPFTDFAAA